MPDRFRPSSRSSWPSGPAPARSAGSSRITSYNVCYTKLLRGNVVVSLGELVAWLAGIAEAKGVFVVTETPAAEPLVENGRVMGVRTGDKGVNRAGEQKSNYQPGADCRAKATVLCEGPRGTIAKVLETQLGLTVGRNAQVYSTGVKELFV